MTYLAGLLAVYFFIFAARKIKSHSMISAPFWNLGFFKLHYMLAGIVLAFIFPADFLLILEPIRVTIITFSLCWIGLYYGCGLELRAHQRFPSQVILTNILEPVFIFAFISIGSIIYIYNKVGGWHHTETALMIGLFSSFTIFRRRGILYRQSHSTHHPVLDNLLPIGNIFPVAALAVTSKLLFEVPEITILEHTFTGTFSFVLLQIITALIGGILLNMSVSAADSSDRISIILIGGTALIGGIATIFSFSPLFVGTLTGAFLVNSTLKRLQTLEALNDSNELIEKVFMFCLGTMITPLFFILKLKLIYLFASALGLFAIRSVLKYILSTIWISRIMPDSHDSSILWIGLTGQGILASGAVVECSYHVSEFTSIFFLFITLLILNQIAIGMYVWYAEKNRRAEGMKDA